MGRSAVGSETEGRVESGFPHGAVSTVEIMGKTDVLAVGAVAGSARRLLRCAHFDLESRPNLRRILARGSNVILTVVHGREKIAYYIGVICWVISHFGNRSIADVEVPRETGVPC